MDSMFKALKEFIISEKNLAEEFLKEVKEEDIIVLCGADCPKTCKM